MIAELGATRPDGVFEPAPVGLETSQATVALAGAVERVLGSAAIDIVPSYRSLLIEFDPVRISYAGVEAQLRQEFAAPRTTREDAPRIVTIPVAYGGEFGPDLEDVATHTGLTPAAVVATHSQCDAYRVAFLGFSPGYAYVLGLSPELATPRLGSPRARVPSGSVAIGGEQTAIYPQATPGGWRLIGRTAVPLFDLARDPAALLQPGDRIRFRSIDLSEFAEIRRRVELGDYRVEIDGPSGEPASKPRRKPRQASSRSRGSFEVVAPGLLTTVQDAGRLGLGAQGISPGGALDRAAFRAANRLVGNHPDDAVLEMTLIGPTLRSNRSVAVALTGADLGATLNGVLAPHWQSFTVPAGGTLAFSSQRSNGAGVRGYLAVAGGIDVPPVIGSRSTDLTAGFGGFSGRALEPGDLLPVGVSAINRATRRNLIGPRPRVIGAEATLRVVVGPHDDLLAPGDLDRLLAGVYLVSSQSNHMGVRLSGPALRVAGAGALISEGIATGTVQVPADGQPIILLPGRGTVGGYAKVACVIDADLDLAAQLRPGTTVRFEAVSLVAAVRAGQRYREKIGWLTGSLEEMVGEPAAERTELSGAAALLRRVEAIAATTAGAASPRAPGRGGGE